MPMEGAMTLSTRERKDLQRHAGARAGRAEQARPARLILPRPEGLALAQIRAQLDCDDRYTLIGTIALLPIGWRDCSPVSRDARATQ